MHFQQELTPHLNTITAYGHGYIEVNAQKYYTSIFMRPEGPVQAWSIRHPNDINQKVIEQIAELHTAEQTDPMAFLNDMPVRYENAPELIIIGTGKQQHFLPPKVLEPFLRSRIGIETMDSQAAARTYNILMSEGRDVVLALIID